MGQLLDLKGNTEDLFNFKLSSENLNNNIIKYKTSSLFSFAFLLGAIFCKEETNIDEFKEMGTYFGFMYQIMDDYKDQDSDEEHANYILKYGLTKSIKKYIHSRTNLINLLKKNNLHTDRFIDLIEIIDKNFSPIHKYCIESDC